MSRFVVIDLAGMEPPDIIETLNYEFIIDALKDDFQARMETLGLDFDVRDLESDPAVKILEVAAAREIVLRARVNGAAKALLLALSQKMDLVHLGALFGVERAVVVPAHFNEAGTLVPAVMETDGRLRTRVQLAPQAFSTAGPYGAYEFNVLLADPTIKSVGIVVPRPGHVAVYPLVADGDGEPSKAVLDRVRKQLLSDDVRPLTDQVTVSSPKIEHVKIDLTLVVKAGPDASILMTQARAALRAYADSRHKVGEGLWLSGIYAAAQVGTAVEHVVIHAPLDDIEPGPKGAVWVEEIIVDSSVMPE
jgi:phage-related baseplate assembly protein